MIIKIETDLIITLGIAKHYALIVTQERHVDYLNDKEIWPVVRSIVELCKIISGLIVLVLLSCLYMQPNQVQGINNNHRVFS